MCVCVTHIETFFFFFFCLFERNKKASTRHPTFFSLSIHNHQSHQFHRSLLPSIHNPCYLFSLVLSSPPSCSNPNAPSLPPQHTPHSYHGRQQRSELASQLRQWLRFLWVRKEGYHTLSSHLFRSFSFISMLLVSTVLDFGPVEWHVGALFFFSFLHLFHVDWSSVLCFTPTPPSLFFDRILIVVLILPPCLFIPLVLPPTPYLYPCGFSFVIIVLCVMRWPMCIRAYMGYLYSNLPFCLLSGITAFFLLAWSI